MTDVSTSCRADGAGSGSTSAGRPGGLGPWRLVSYEAYQDAEDARVREQVLKQFCGSYRKLMKRIRGSRLVVLTAGGAVLIAPLILGLACPASSVNFMDRGIPPQAGPPPAFAMRQMTDRAGLEQAFEERPSPAAGGEEEVVEQVRRWIFADDWREDVPNAIATQPGFDAARMKLVALAREVLVARSDNTAKVDEPASRALALLGLLLRVGPYRGGILDESGGHGHAKVKRLIQEVGQIQGGRAAASTLLEVIASKPESTIGRSARTVVGARLSGEVEFWEYRVLPDALDAFVEALVNGSWTVRGETYLLRHPMLETLADGIIKHTGVFPTQLAHLEGMQQFGTPKTDRRGGVYTLYAAQISAVLSGWKQSTHYGSAAAIAQAIVTTEPERGLRFLREMLGRLGVSSVTQSAIRDVIARQLEARSRPDNSTDGDSAAGAEEREKQLAGRSSLVAGEPQALRATSNQQLATGLSAAGAEERLVEALQAGELVVFDDRSEVPVELTIPDDWVGPDRHAVALKLLETPPDLTGIVLVDTVGIPHGTRIALEAAGVVYVELPNASVAELNETFREPLPGSHRVLLTDLETARRLPKGIPNGFVLGIESGQQAILVQPDRLTQLAQLIDVALRSQISVLLLRNVEAATTEFRQMQVLLIAA